MCIVQLVHYHTLHQNGCKLLLSPLYLLMDKISSQVGRVWTLIFSFILCGSLGIALIATPDGDVWFQPTLVILGKAVATIFWLCCGLHTSELFPTATRNATFCFLDASSKMGAALAPFLVDMLSLINNRLPNVVIGILTVLAALPYIFLPETLTADVPRNVEDMAGMKNIIAKKAGCNTIFAKKS